jgi:hypothetical protein
MALEDDLVEVGRPFLQRLALLAKLHPKEARLIGLRDAGFGGDGSLCPWGRR